MDSHVTHPDRLKVVLGEAGVRYELIPHPQPGAFGVVAILLESDDGCMDIEEQNEAAYQACLKIAQAALRYASSDLRGILRDEFTALRARADAVAEELRLADADAERLANGCSAPTHEANNYNCEEWPPGEACRGCLGNDERKLALAAHEARLKAREEPEHE